jgi:hypothetical protein
MLEKYTPSGWEDLEHQTSEFGHPSGQCRRHQPHINPHPVTMCSESVALQAGTLFVLLSALF